MGPLQFVHGETGCSVVIDDGDVAMAYLQGPDGDIIGDVWLYNRVATAPLANPPTLAKPLDRPLPKKAADFSVQWTLDGELLLADVFLHGALLARLSPGSAPGWNVLATASGPCAQPLLHLIPSPRGGAE